jgi:hypothetical protein
MHMLGGHHMQPLGAWKYCTQVVVVEAVLCTIKQL